MKDQFSWSSSHTNYVLLCSMSKNSFERVVYENSKGRHYAQYKFCNYSFWNVFILGVYGHSMATQMNFGYLQLTLIELTYRDQIIVPIYFRISIILFRSKECIHYWMVTILKHDSVHRFLLNLNTSWFLKNAWNGSIKFNKKLWCWYKTLVVFRKVVKMDKSSRVFF